MKVRQIAKLIAPLGVIVAVALGGGIAWHCRSRPEEQFAQALVALKNGDLDRVSEIQRVLKDKPPFREHARLLRGAVFLRNGKHRLAIAELESVVPSGILREPALELTGECLYGMGRLAEAEPLMRQLLAENPDHADAHRWLGAIYYNLGANNLAIAELKIVIRLAPQDYMPHRLIGLMNFDFEQHSQAIEHYRKALALSPPRAVRKVIVRELAKSLVSKRDYKTALSVLADTKPDAYTLSLQGECYWSLGNSELAFEVLKKAVALNPDERAIFFLKARILIGDGRHQEAIAPLKRVLRRNPLYSECRYQLALVYRQLGRSKDYERELARWKASKKLWERLTELNIQAIRSPGDASVRDDLAEICNKLGKHKLSTMWRQAAEACRQFGDKHKRSAPIVTPGGTGF